MKTLLTVLCALLMTGGAFAECSSGCKDKVPDSKVTELTQCEKADLQAAESKLTEVKNNILIAHGMPNSSWGSLITTWDCSPRHYKTYDLLNDKYVVEVDNVYTPSYCVTSIVSTTLTSSH